MQRGVPAQALKQVDPAEFPLGEVALEAQKPTQTPKERSMLIPKPTLTRQAVEQFKLHMRNPFEGEVRSDAELFATGEIGYIVTNLKTTRDAKVGDTVTLRKYFE